MSPVKMSRIEEGMRTVMAYNEAFRRRDVPGMVQLAAEGCVLESSGPAPKGGVHAGREAIGQYWQGFFRDVQGLVLKVEELHGLGKRVIMRWQHTWVDAGGEKRQLRGADIFRVEDSLIVEQLSYVKGDGARQSRA